MSSMQRTDTRSLIERKASVAMRIIELRKALGEAERCEAEIAIAIEDAERCREEERRANVAAE